MKDFFNTPARLAALRAEAAKWIGTPWVPNSASPGVGVSCHHLPRSIYVACGALPPGFPIVVGDPAEGRYAKISRMESFNDSRKEFKRLALDDLQHDIQPGDLLGIRIYHCIDHLGVALEEGLFIHVLMHKHTDFDMRGVAPWSQRIEAAWRIVED